jgi:hypothetical protein
MRILTTKGNLLLIGIVLFWMICHVILRSTSSGFAVGPPSPEHSFAGVLFKIELIAHIAVLGIVITAIRNRIGWWKKPTYGDDGLLSLQNTAKIAGTSYESLPTQWNEIGFIFAEFFIYIALWSMILQLLHL